MPPKRRIATGLLGVSFQNVEFFLLSDVGISDVTFEYCRAFCLVIC